MQITDFINLKCYIFFAWYWF